MTPTRWDGNRDGFVSREEFQRFVDETRDDNKDLRYLIAQCASQKLMDEREVNIHKLYGWVNDLKLWLIGIILAAIGAVVWMFKEGK